MTAPPSSAATATPAALAASLGWALRRSPHCPSSSRPFSHPCCSWSFSPLLSPPNGEDASDAAAPAPGAAATRR